MKAELKNWKWTMGERREGNESLDVIRERRKRGEGW
jgi:hypothetical protein